MKSFIKLAELNWSLTLANRAEIEAQESKEREAISDAKRNVRLAQEALDKHLNSKRMVNEFNKVDAGKINKSDIEKAVLAAGYDSAIMDFVG